MDDPYAATPNDRFSFGLWTVGHRGGDPFGLPTRPPIQPEEMLTRIAEVGAWGVSFHDDDLVPLDPRPPTATGSSRASAGPSRTPGCACR